MAADKIHMAMDLKVRPELDQAAAGPKQHWREIDFRKLALPPAASRQRVPAHIALTTLLLYQLRRAAKR